MYTGDLVAFPIVPLQPNFPAFYVSLNGINITDGKGTRVLTSWNHTGGAVPARIEAGTTLTYLPQSVLTPLIQGFGVTMIGNNNGYVPCTLLKANASVDFTFGSPDGLVIRWPLSSIIEPFDISTNGSADYSFYNDGNETCKFMIGVTGQGGGADQIVLGDSFLRSTYVVFDATNSQVAVAQAAVSPTSGSVTPIPAGTEIPGCSSTNTFSLNSSQKNVKYSTILNITYPKRHSHANL